MSQEQHGDRESFLGTTSRNVPQPNIVHKHNQDVLQQSKGEDHTVTHTHRLSLRRYPRDCPPLRVRWFYAVDSPKWKPQLWDQKKDASKTPPPPKKFVPFSSKDSHAIETAFQRLSDIEAAHEQSKHSEKSGMPQGSTAKVAVNEDYLFDVDVERRELCPAYWVGPVYEVRRGTWFFQDGSSIKPCEENLATQLEEGYLKVKPWRFHDIHDTSTQPFTQPSTHSKSFDTAAPGLLPNSIGHTAPVSPGGLPNHRLFGAYMRSIVTYQDHSAALITNDDFMSRVSTTVYQKLGGVPGTKIVRGFIDSGKEKGISNTRRPAEELLPETPVEGLEAHEANTYGSVDARAAYSQYSHRSSTGDISKSTLEQQMSSLTGETQDEAQLEEQARRQEEKEMEDSREVDNEDRERQIDHLVLVTHGIGQRLGLRLESINFIHDVNVLRKTMKNVYKASPDLQALNSAFADNYTNCRVQVLPVCWRHLLDFPYRGARHTRKELDLADADSSDDDLFPSLADITLESVPAVRNLISDLAMDVLLYQSDYREHISNIVSQESNRILKLFKERNPSFSGSVSLCGHSLGSAIFFDILCREQPGRESDQKTSVEKTNTPENRSRNQQLHFECEELFCLGSPIALFQMLKGKTIAGRSAPGISRSGLPLYSAEETEGIEYFDTQNMVSSPKCRRLYNIFHPSDPVSYRIEPLISPAMSSLRPQPLPSVKKSLWSTSGQSLSIIGSRVGQSVGSLWNNFTSGVASSLLNRSLGLNPDDDTSQISSSEGIQMQQSKSSPDGDIANPHPDRHPTLIDSGLETLYEGFQRTRKDERQESLNPSGNSSMEDEGPDDRLKKIRTEDAKVRALNNNGRVDYSIQEGAFDISLIASIASHLTYWADEDVSHFLLSQMLSKKRPH
ncbi:phosphatidic acid-preferring phospholipase A1 [Aspergillus steynii IBT 23096]|uniref:Phosphatidic acid-preferring phospholipase A1 n=1 Tax=Aspergillus steynii IBT 23096 TaxID=1392250 RepID=A0A2I2G2B4_9EURO|nr:phosphatidic acid-preferring phospholipase A1 [Aspergillus steynii IBT 23096]PLB47011.1 phosphatidic acid-preferring phospholipase A1 [Aspergillus steynii IBT 23096]